MKTMILTLLVFAAISGFGQPLMLSCTKGQIRSEMSRHESWAQISGEPMQYLRDSTIVEYLFENKHCNEASITMPVAEADKFIAEKIDCNCWKEVAPDIWIYETNHFDARVLVYRISEKKFIRFKYRFETN